MCFLPEPNGTEKTGVVLDVFNDGVGEAYIVHFMRWSRMNLGYIQEWECFSMNSIQINKWNNLLRLSFSLWAIWFVSISTHLFYLILK